MKRKQKTKATTMTMSGKVREEVGAEVRGAVEAEVAEAVVGDVGVAVQAGVGSGIGVEALAGRKTKCRGCWRRWRPA